FFFFFQAEDGIRDKLVTGVQTCALPISIEIRPIAGTRARGATAAEDERNASELLADPKECAEHIMLVDLARNDVGRVADFGTVRSEERRVGKECRYERGG